MPSLTVVHLIHAYARRPQSSVWIVPGSLDDFEGPEKEELYPHITDYLPKRGFEIASKTKPEEADRMIAEIIAKFQHVGVEVVADSACDD